MATQAQQPTGCSEAISLNIAEEQMKPHQEEFAIEDAASDLSTEPGSDLDQAVEDEKFNAPTCFSVEETLIFFDWDDTLCPTTWIQDQGLMLDPSPHLSKQQTEQLGRLAENAKCALVEAKRHGSVVIVTNAEQGWVQASCELFMPALAPLLGDVQIISARSSYEWVSGCPSQWKRLAFTRVVHGFYDGHQSCMASQIISIGDSMHERIALVTAAKDVPNCRAKNLKFIERPHVEQLAQALELVSGSLGQVAAHDGDLDLQVL